VGAGDAFVTKLNPQGSALLFSTYLGGSGDDAGIGIAVDGSGNAYVTGFTPSADFPTKNPIQPLLPSNSGSAFVTKLSSTGSLVYSTFLGGTGSQQKFNIPLFSGKTNISFLKFDIGLDIAVDSANPPNAYIVGATGSGNLPTTIGSSQPDLDLQLDAFVIKLDPTGTVIRYSTYIGGSDIDIGFGIALDSQTNVYVTGSTFSTDFPTISGLPFPADVNNRGTCDLGLLLLCEGFVFKLSGDAADQPPLQFVNFPTTFTALPSQGGVDVPFVGNIGVGGGTPPYVVVTTQGTNPPPGLQFGSPVLSGTPTQAGLFQFFVQVTDSLGNVISKILEIDISSDPVISVIPASQDFGSVAVGSTADRSFTVQNFGGGTLAGSASTSAPFSIEAGGSYSLGPGLSQVVTVRFSPTSVVASSVDVTFTGDVGATVTVTGTVPGATPTFTLTVIKAAGSGDGTVTGGTGIDCLPDCTETFNSGTPVTLIANPAAGSSFAGFTGDADCSDGAVTMTSDRNCTATFSKIFTDDTLIAGATVIKRVQITELREAANQLLGGSGPFPFTEPTLTAGVTTVKRSNITELRTALTQAAVALAALTQAAVALGKPTPSFSTDPTIIARQTVIKAAHITELRAAVRALE
jgi:hypothetical protein